MRAVLVGAALAVLACQADTTSAFTPEPALAGGDRIFLEGAARAGGVTIRVRADRVHGLYGGTFVLAYDPTLVKVAAVRAGDLTDGSGALATTHGLPQDVAGSLTVGFVCNDEEGDGTLAEIDLDALRSGTGALAFQAPDLFNESLTRKAVDHSGTAVVGVRWQGGSLAVVQP